MSKSRSVANASKRVRTPLGSRRSRLEGKASKARGECLSGVMALFGALKRRELFFSASQVRLPREACSKQQLLRPVKLKRPCVEFSISVICIGGLSGRPCLGKIACAAESASLLSLPVMAGCQSRVWLAAPNARRSSCRIATIAARREANRTTYRR